MLRTMRRFSYCSFFIWFLCSGIAHAQLQIEIIGSGADQFPIAIAPLKGEAGLPQSVTAVVASDLQRSGLFKLVDSGGLTAMPSEPAEMDYPMWQTRGANAVVIGSVTPLAGNRYDIRFRLMDVIKQQQLIGFAYQVTPEQLRGTAHRIADAIYEKLTGDAGVFSTRVTYVIKKDGRYELQVADADGYGAKMVFASNDPVISPAWSPDGSKLAYVSFERQKPVVYIQSLLTGQRSAVANFRGSNSAPTWSPDGSRLAVVLSKEGNSQIYMINVDGSGVKRLMSSSLIDTEPDFSPDGQWLLFTSDRGGSPQVYRVSVNGGEAERLTFDGNYNVSPRYAPDGKTFTFIQRNSGKFSVAVEDFTSKQTQLLTEGGMDESPSFAPNGKMILYATEINGRGILAAVSSDGRVRQRLTVESGDVRNPAWGPLLKTQ